MFIRIMAFLFLFAGNDKSHNVSLVREENLDENNEKVRWQETVRFFT